MSLRTRCVAATLLPALLFACRTSENGVHPAPGADRVAEVNGRAISQADLDEWIRQDLFERETRDKSAAELYELRSGALEQLIDERVLSDESARRELSEDELIAAELAALPPVSDADVSGFYEEHRERLGEITLEQIAPRIREHLEGERVGDVLAALRERASVVVHLEAPRIAIAADGPSRGPADARVTIVEFSDFQCPFCRRVLPALKEVMERYPDDVRLVYRHMPLDSVHPRARPAAEAAACADEQGGFWEYHDRLFSSPGSLGDEDLRRLASEIGLDAARFEKCVGERTFREKVEADSQVARESGITGTPAFFVNGIPMSGARAAEEFVELIETELRRSEVAESG